MLQELNLKPGMRCLDLGCGTGYATEIIDRFVRPDGSVIGCDVSEPMLEIAREKLSGSAITKFVKQDILSFLHDQRDNSVDLITAFWAIGYTEPAKVLKESGVSPAIPSLQLIHQKKPSVYIKTFG